MQLAQPRYAHITQRTVAIFASAPSFSHGVVDPIEELGALAVSRDIGLHVDNCLGGYLLSYMQREGLYSAPFDFAVRGVTSMSVDIHKYGCANKGASVACFRDPALRRATYVPSVEGCEGLYVTPTLQGSRSGATIAAAWATIVHLGDDGYARMARDITACHTKIKATVRAMAPLRLCCDADATVVPICSDGINVYALASLLEERGWGVFTGQKPPTLTITVGEQTPAYVDDLLDDLRECLAYLIAHPECKASGNAAVYGAAAKMPRASRDDPSRLCGHQDVSQASAGRCTFGAVRSDETLDGTSRNVHDPFNDSIVLKQDATLPLASYLCRPGDHAGDSRGRPARDRHL